VGTSARTLTSERQWKMIVGCFRMTRRIWNKNRTISLVLLLQPCYFYIDYSSILLFCTMWYFSFDIFIIYIYYSFILLFLYFGGNMILWLYFYWILMIIYLFKVGNINILIYFFFTCFYRFAGVLNLHKENTTYACKFGWFFSLYFGYS
jgi:hypothetical protein